MTTSAPESPVQLPHSVPASGVLAALATDRQRGLSSEDADERLHRYGPNALPEDGGPGLLLRALRQFHHPLIYVLLVAGAVTAGLGEYVDSAVIFAVVLLNALIGFIQEQKAEAALQGLRSMVLPEARVVRDGRAQIVASERLVPGDLVLLEAGERAPADIRVVQAAELRVDESTLTGESVPTLKTDATLAPETLLADRHNIVHAGTLVTTGTGTGAVVATGADTELGAIHRLVGAAELLATPLTRKLSRFTRDLTVVILGLAALTFAVGQLRGQDAAETFTAAVALAVGAIPEGLPAAITIVLAIGVTRMAKRRAVVRRLPAVETLGSTTVICSDKTGTLTENRMTVRSLWLPGDQDVDVPEASRSGALAAGAAVDGALRWSLLAGAACNDARIHRHDGEWGVVGDPTEAALLVVAAEAGAPQDEIEAAYPRVDTIAFDSTRQFMATLHRSPGDASGHVALAKGAAERLAQMCGTQLMPDGEQVPLDHAGVERALHRLSGHGLRVLATAVVPETSPAEFADGGLEGRWVLTGLQGMLDPPRGAAVDAVRACRDAGIAVKMITGDHAATATAIATQVGLLEEPTAGGTVLSGTDLAALTVAEYPEAISRAVVLARVSPEQKLRLVEALQARGHIVAMTGDGVNDAPALRQADIGVAMGRSGTEVAKDAADIILTDDDFATIEAAVEEGRGIFDNLTKFITWTLPTNIAEGLVILVAILLGTVLPIQPTQILWINMTTAVALGLMLAFEPKESGVMTRPPRDPGQAILTRTVVFRVLLLSAMLVGGSWWLFQFELANGADLAEARTAAVNVFVAVEAFYLLNCRSLTQSVWRIGLWSNPWIIVGIAVQLVAQLALTYAPFMHRVFGTAPLDAGTWLRIVALGALASAVVAGEKWLRRRAEVAAGRTPSTGTWRR